jgi:DNA-binding response OmpR family regulator
MKVPSTKPTGSVLGDKKELGMSMKVLICDLDWRFSRQASLLLESRAHLVVQHNQADEAIAAARRWQPDLAIVSEELANTGLIEQLEAIEPRPAILLVGWMDRYDKVWRAWQRGGDELLMKPVFNWAELHAAIVAAMENAVSGVRHRAVLASA